MTSHRAYGLLEFNDMKQVYPVDKDLIPRVRDWLFSRKDGKGQFLRGIHGDCYKSLHIT